jgi:hypothetical protein
LAKASLSEFTRGIGDNINIILGLTPYIALISYQRTI